MEAKGPSIADFRDRLRRWGAAHRRSFPWRGTADPFRILVAEVLLQRSRGKTVAGVYSIIPHHPRAVER